MPVARYHRADRRPVGHGHQDHDACAPGFTPDQWAARIAALADRAARDLPLFEDGPGEPDARAERPSRRRPAG
jgi:hypothetical protein